MGNLERKLRSHQRTLQALELRKAGATYEDIAAQLGYKNRSCAWAAVKSALKSTVKEPAEEVRTLEVARLDSLFLAMYPKARKGDVQAVDRCVRISERRSKLLGLDAATNVDVKSDGKPIGSAVSDERRLAALVALNDRIRARVASTGTDGGDSVGSAAGAADGSVSE